MIYINKEHIENIGIHWSELVNEIRSASEVLTTDDFAQPVKPYLRYRDLKNRIIAMPAFIGGDINFAGIKWIASFPGNINRSDGVPRANSVTILNDADTGQVRSIVNTPFISGIRTSAVTGFVIEEYCKVKQINGSLKVGITGFGPIGQLHLSMVLSLLGDRIGQVSIYDPRAIDRSLLPEDFQDRIHLVSSWEEAYQDADIFMTCTVSKAPYINLAPKKGSLQLNVSLRDYVAEYRQFVDLMIVDDWEEVCRENTDIENMHKQVGLREEDTSSIADLASGQIFANLVEDDVVMFNPMGMAVFDIAIASYYYRQCLILNEGVQLENETIAQLS